MYTVYISRKISFSYITLESNFRFFFPNKIMPQTRWFFIFNNVLIEYILYITCGFCHFDRFVSCILSGFAFAFSRRTPSVKRVKKECFIHLKKFDFFRSGIYLLCRKWPSDIAIYFVFYLWHVKNLFSQKED